MDLEALAPIIADIVKESLNEKVYILVDTKEVQQIV